MFIFKKVGVVIPNRNEKEMLDSIKEINHYGSILTMEEASIFKEDIPAMVIVLKAIPAMIRKFKKDHNCFTFKGCENMLFPMKDSDSLKAMEKEFN